GDYAGHEGEGFWVNTLMGHSCRMDISTPDKVVYSWILNNDLGLDTDYVASGLAWVFELYERGVITREDTDGLELHWGDGDAFIAMMKKLAYREGIGDILADGMVEAAEHFGDDALYYLAHMNGQPSIEPFRTCKGWGLAVATSPVAGRHLRGSSIGSNRFGPRPRPDSIPVDPLKYENQARITYWQARSKELEDNLGVCNYVGTWSGGNFETIGNFANFIRYGLGMEIGEEDLMEHYAKVGRNLEKAFNSLLTDMKREDDLPPKRFRTEEVASGPHRGRKADEEGYNRMLDEFYDYWGWDRETGLQTEEALASLGLSDVAERLDRVGKLVNKK
ncbi:MAG: aldehyde ferredoxin oxidoreductase C-terminal domain-containing protein, partial [Synergistales bacterium]|nr:aldehyde ferredoxin oxidoreductase C-terminal domain-containing protein [Synergistales bacterium]